MVAIQFLIFGTTPFTMPGIVDYNYYMFQGAGGNNAWGWTLGATSKFATWQSAPPNGCSCEAHSGYSATSTINANGSPTSSFPGIGVGINLTSIATANLAALAASTSDGDTGTPTARPPSTAWSIGAYQ